MLDRLRRLTLIALIAASGCGYKQRAEQIQITPANAQDVLHAVRNSGARAVLVNMWASWCGPCREEFPDLLRLRRDYLNRGLQVIFVSWDDEPQAARDFLARQGVDFPSFIKSTAQRDPEFIEAIEPRWSGAFPATLIYDASGKLRFFFEGARPYRAFEQKVLEVLTQTSANTVSESGGK